ncbi:unnamed protein product, partial [Sphacelaria rigidula]
LERRGKVANPLADVVTDTVHVQRCALSESFSRRIVGRENKRCCRGSSACCPLLFHILRHKTRRHELHVHCIQTVQAVRTVCIVHKRPCTASRILPPLSDRKLENSLRP